RMRPPRPGAITVRLTQADGNVTEETNRSPRFLGNPRVTAPTSRDRGGTALPGRSRRAGAAPARAHGRGSHDKTNFGAEGAGSGHTPTTLRPGVAPPGRKTRFRL